ncbi:unnamed protein product [Haemonchus placei]|uniref:Coat protein n=1 Tax=Haemonchus placei TaxID=6290 RepID=A0A0N4WRS4_HAEPC|nr:unnamed protein product [Haemonchus placei]
MASTSSATTSTSTSTKFNSPTMGSKRVERQSQLITKRSVQGNGFSRHTAVGPNGDQGSASLPKRNRRTLPIWQAVLVPPISAIWASDGNLRIYGTGIATKRSSSSMPPPTVLLRLMALSLEKFGGITPKGGFNRPGILLGTRLRSTGFWPNHIGHNMWSNPTFRADTFRWSSNTMTLRRPSKPLRFGALTSPNFDLLLAQLDLDVLPHAVLRLQSTIRLSVDPRPLDFDDALVPPDMQHNLRSAAQRRLAGGDWSLFEASFMGDETSGREEVPVRGRGRRTKIL